MAGYGAGQYRRDLSPRLPRDQGHSGSSGEMATSWKGENDGCNSDCRDQRQPCI